MPIGFVRFVFGRYDSVLKLVLIPDIGYDLWSDWYDSFVIHRSSICYLGDFCKSENKKETRQMASLKSFENQGILSSRIAREGYWRLCVLVLISTKSWFIHDIVVLSTE